jgi:hypothetical protein
MGKNGQTSLVVTLRCAQNLATKWPPTPLNCSKKSLRGPEEKPFFIAKGGGEKNREPQKNEISFKCPT